MANSEELGPVATTGKSYRARAEARQREYRARELRAGCGRYGHWLDGESADAGRNFVIPTAHEAARERAAAGKGVAPRTFTNMLSSQAMCFNIFAPLAVDPGLATEVLSPLIPGLIAVRSITIEHTPPKTIFLDQTGLAGVDCDVLIEAGWCDGESAIIVVETKFVEPEFSVCGFRKKVKGTGACPDDVRVRGNRQECRYTSSKGFGYWEQSDRHQTLSLATLTDTGCPFRGAQWQLWVNHTLAHAESALRGAKHALFAVCAPLANRALLGSDVIEAFRAHLARPETLLYVPLDALLRRIAIVADGRGETMRPWHVGLTARYANL